MGGGILPIALSGFENLILSITANRDDQQALWKIKKSRNRNLG
jgi:hypothetical protein